MERTPTLTPQTRYSVTGSETASDICMILLDHLFVLVFAVLYPTYAFFVYRKIKPDLIADKPGVRWRDYRETSLWLWLFGLVGLANWVYQGRPLADLGLGTPTSWPAITGAPCSDKMIRRSRSLEQNSRRTRSRRRKSPPAQLHRMK